MRQIVRAIERRLAAAISPNRYLPIQFDITNFCNLRCTHCYHPDHNNDGALSLSDWFQILDQYEQLVERVGYRKCLFICGGEPTSSPMLQPLLEELVRRGGYRVGLLTNATLVNRIDFSLVKKFPRFDIQVSVDGHSAEAHDLVRGKGNFARTKDGIYQLKNAGIDVNILAILSKRTSGQIAEFFDFAIEVGAKSMNFTRLINQGYAKDLTESNLDRPLGPLELRKAYKSIVTESARSGVKTNLNAPLFRLLDSNLGGSGLFDEGLVVDHRGNLLASSRSRLILGHAIRDGLDKIFFDHPIYQSLRAGKIDVCGKCRYYAACGGDRNAAFAESGNYLGKDPGCWLEEIQNTQTIEVKEQAYV